MAVYQEQYNWIHRCSEAAIEMIRKHGTGEPCDAERDHFIKLKDQYDAWKAAHGIELAVPPGPNVRVSIPDAVRKKIAAYEEEK